MENKEKQIEAMAKIMCGNDCEECAKESAEFYNQTLEEARNNICLLKNCAKTLYAQGYRKLPKDARVFIPTDEQYIMLSREEYHALLLEQKRLKEMVDKIPCGYELKEKTSKETAEKIIYILKDYYGHISVIDKIAKQFGVEMEE